MSNQLAAQVQQSPAPSVELYGLSSIASAALIGGAFASGYLVYRNLSAANLRKDAKRAAALFSVIGVIALFSTWHTPPDFLSFMLFVGIPQIAVVVAAAWALQAAVLSSHRAAGGKLRSLWFALVPGVVANVSIKVLFYGISIATAG